MLVQLGMKSSGSEPKGNIFLLFSSLHKRFSTENFCLSNNTEKKVLSVFETPFPKFRELQKFCFNTQQTLNNKQVNKQKIDKQRTKHMSSFFFSRQYVYLSIQYNCSSVIINKMALDLSSVLSNLS